MIPVQTAISKMTPLEFNDLLAEPVKVDFPMAALGQPTITWKTHTGSLYLNELPKLLKQVYDHSFQCIPENMSEKECIQVKLDNIQNCQIIAKKIQAIITRISVSWSEKTLGDLGKAWSAIGSLGSGNNQVLLSDLESTMLADQTSLNLRLSALKAMEAAKRAKEEAEAAERARQQAEAAKRARTQYPAASGQRNYYTYFYHDPFMSAGQKRSTSYAYDNNIFFDEILLKYLFGNMPRMNVMPKKPKIDSFKVLGLSPDATKTEIKKKYHQLAREWHPDKNLDNPAAKIKFQELQDAYDDLKQKYNIV